SYISDRGAPPSLVRLEAKATRLLRSVAGEIGAVLLVFRRPRAEGRVAMASATEGGTAIPRLVILATAAFLLAALCDADGAQEGTAKDGLEVFKKCAACHDVGPEAKNKVGPVLNGIIGRHAGTIEGFTYSPANKAAGANGLVWTEDVLLQYL